MLREDIAIQNRANNGPGRGFLDHKQTSTYNQYSYRNREHNLLQNSELNKEQKSNQINTEWRNRIVTSIANRIVCSIFVNKHRLRSYM